ncbi:cell division control protein 11 [Trichomonascus vanleenenianus]|uniref:cell division control protein 11 n=1 Tax=Trichomonascus vanleenenianus TaxID=2268995 RepID=UPI003ECB09A1
MPSAALLRAKKSQKRGLKFTVMLCGAGGCGKTTFINTLCGREVVSPLDRPVFDAQEAHEDPVMELVTVCEDLPDDHNGVLTIKFIDTPGFGDSLDNTQSFERILRYIEEQFDEVLAEESRIKRNPKFTDNRVHALIYFIEATGHGLREMDVEFMKLLASKVNIVPVLAKADALTPDELVENKRLIMEDIEHYNIPVYSFPLDDEDEDEDDVDAYYSEEAGEGHESSLKHMLPFAVIGGSTWIKVGGKTVQARQYPWGYVDIEDPKCSDFAVLSDVLLRTHLLDLKETTHDFLYENYRTDKLSSSLADVSTANSSTVSLPRQGGLQPPQVPYGNGTAKKYAVMPSNGSVHSEARSASYVMREEQLRMQEEELKSVEQRVQEEILRKREELLRREQELRELEARLQEQAAQLSISEA